MRDLRYLGAWSGWVQPLNLKSVEASAKRNMDNQELNFCNRLAIY